MMKDYEMVEAREEYDKEKRFGVAWEKHQKEPQSTYPGLRMT